ncbi:TRAP-type C4-dicarboxylate transport system, substrate-binding protein [Paracoccus halophilus]|uniref:C4-dicarboxylate ABC transporter n=1 Tax=Paracoccus halophilus TaxID=376733 RepID=A0A099F2X1_9RHOB|nr:TRAP transporter substrate-binding protein DctP [Paracoccus halophilus]KGJ04507.1 C4-dicarboxylate ABC transporter [Paracoccus halophilus]SFA54621.1 TRAP-type C4-dicarboxylate transport system, substrate-binding protein [Paracoccus halophilus]
MTLKTLTAASLAALTIGAGMAEAETWRYAFEEALDEVQGKFAQKFKAEVEANSDNEVQLFPFGTLGESVDIMEQAQSGILQFVDQSPGFTGALIPEAQVFFVPYLLPQDQDQLFSFFRNSKAVKELFPPLYAEQGLELLTMFPEGEVMMTTTEPVRAPADLNEVKFRVMTNPLIVESYQAFGATPTPLPWGQVYGALQTGMIQGQENPAFFIESTKMYEVTDYITRPGHNNFTTAVMANKDFYDALSDEDKQVVQNAIAVAFDYILEYQDGLTEESLAKIREAKPAMTITTLTEEERAPFRETAAAVEQKYLEIGGAQAQAILDQMKADLQAASESAQAEAAAAN